jgi:hypothetical protein
VLLTGAVEDHHLSDILDMDLEQQHEEAMAVPHALTRVSATRCPPSASWPPCSA